MQRYSEYKPSGIQWLKEIPSHWEKRRVKHLASMKSGDAIRKEYMHDDGPFPVYGGGKRLGYTNCYNTTENDILIGRVGAKCGCVTLPSCKAWATDNALVLTTDGNCRFLAFTLSAANLNHLNTSNAQPLITATKVLNFHIPLPPLPEQERIVNFIERKTFKVNSYVTERERELQLLNELKQAEIANVVTRGLNPDVKMKDSGIPWIGMIPKHWEVEPFGRHFSFGKGLPITKADLTEKGVAVISYGQIHAKTNVGYTLSNDLVRYVDTIFLESNAKSLLLQGDFVFADTSEDIAGSGNFVFNDYNDTIFAGYHTVIARPKDLPYPKYFACLFSSVNWKSQVQAQVNGVKVYSIGKRHLKNTYIIVPPLSEQRAIVAHIEQKCSKVNSLITELEAEIEYLKEYKQRLIADCVTGQVCVQNG